VNILGPLEPVIETLSFVRSRSLLGVVRNLKGPFHKPPNQLTATLWTSWGF